ncbi:MAG: hypothetical protein JJT99_11845 [Rhodobacteraceae bacterium]|nr:hypothetical protein [Paracoccaceae bacterium]
MKPPKNTPFLARDSYRMRRLMDAARFLPVLGLILLLLPLMRLDQQAETPPTAAEAAYLFLVWFALVAAAFLMSLGLRKTLEPHPGAVPPARQQMPDQISALISGVQRNRPEATDADPPADAQSLDDRGAASPSPPRPDRSDD